MGEANLRFARGDNETAIRMCMEVIRQDPSAPEPFQTLSNLYEENGEQVCTWLSSNKRGTIIDIFFLAGEIASVRNPGSSLGPSRPRGVGEAGRHIPGA